MPSSEAEVCWVVAPTKIMCSAYSRTVSVTLLEKMVFSDIIKDLEIILEYYCEP
jgi:hypothetical protein